MNKRTAREQLDRILDGIDALILTAPASELGIPRCRERDASEARRVVRAAGRRFGEVGPSEPVRSDSAGRLEIVRDFVRRHPEHQRQFSMVFGKSKPSEARIDDAWETIQRLEQQSRRKQSK